MKSICPRIVIAGSGSGVGKTSITLGLARCLARQGLRVQTFKVGPDFLDPTYLALASGRTCYNLDGWMTSRDYVRQLFARATANADIALVEGVMGMFDGASPTSLEGSTAEIAQWLKAPVLLIVNAHGVARSLAAVVKGFVEFEPGVRVAGVIANQGGSERHRLWLSESLAGAGGVPLFGMLPRGSLPALPSRHLGLVTADGENLSNQILDHLAQVLAKHLDVRAIVELARSAGDLEIDGSSCISNVDAGPRPIRLGIAWDEAFHFYYADNLESLAEAGAELISFSPLADSHLPADLDGLYLGGGYPELYVERLAENSDMLAEVRAFADSGRAIYAECGGLMYLGRSLAALDGTCYPLCGVLPIETAMKEKLNVLGYTEATWTGDSLWGSVGTSVRGHEFHYSHIMRDESRENGWRSAYQVCRKRSGTSDAGFVRGRILAGYPHLHWASRPETVRYFLSHCEARS